MDLKITKDDGQTYTLGQEGITVHDVNVKGIELDTMTEQIAGLHGDFNIGATYKSREIVVPFSFKGASLSEYPLFRDLLFQLATDIKPFYIQELRRPDVTSYTFKDTTRDTQALTLDEYGFKTVYDNEQNYHEEANAVRYRVRLTGAVEIEQKKHTSEGRGELTFETVGLPFAESVATSLWLQDNGLEFIPNNVFSFGQGLEPDNGQYNYTLDLSKDKTLDIYNIGDVPIDQFNMYYRIVFKLNEPLTGQLWFGFNKTDCMIDGSKMTFKAGDEIVVNYGGYFRNKLSIQNATNFETPEIPVGKSTFMVDKNINATVSVDMRFYYL